MGDTGNIIRETNRVVRRDEILEPRRKIIQSIYSKSMYYVSLSRDCTSPSNKCREQVSVRRVARVIRKANLVPRGGVDRENKKRNLKKSRGRPNEQPDGRDGLRATRRAVHI